MYLLWMCMGAGIGAMAGFAWATRVYMRGETPARALPTHPNDDTEWRLERGAELALWNTRNRGDRYAAARALYSAMVNRGIGGPGSETVNDG